jgi:Disulfide bond formation protein DsbB
MLTLQRNLNALLIIILSGVLLSAFGVQFFEHEEPCPLCLLQRLGMLGVAFAAALNIRFGIRPLHYGLGLLSCVVGGGVALRQIALHVCPGFAKFGIPVLGLSLYTWSFVVFVCSVTFIALCLLMYNPQNIESEVPRLNAWQKFALGLLTFLAFANGLSTYFICGWGPCD